MDVQNSKINESDIQANANLSGLDLSGLDLSNADLLMADLSNAILTEVNLEGAVLNSANLTGADLTGANLSDAALIKSDLSNANLSKADLRRADFREGVLNGANFKDANLEESNFTKAPTDEPNLSGAELSDTDFRGANLSGANFAGVDISDAKFEKTDLIEADTVGTKVEQETSGASINEPRASAAHVVEEPFNNPGIVKSGQELLQDNSKSADDNGWIRSNNKEKSERNESEFDKGKDDRAYLLVGISADPYTSDSSHGFEEDDMKQGYVRLTVTGFTVGDQNAVKLHFGRGTWEGGYIWLLDEGISQLQTILASLETISGGEVSGQGKVLDLDSFPFQTGANDFHRVSGSKGKEMNLSLKITSRTEEGVAADLRLGEKEKSGVDVTMSDAQLLDLLVIINKIPDVDRNNLPGKYTGSTRIGPSGKDTWELGTGIEEEINPDPPNEYKKSSRDY